MCGFGFVFSRHPTRTHVTHPLPDNERGPSLAGAAALRFAVLARAPPSREGATFGEGREIYRKTFTPAGRAAQIVVVEKYSSFQPAKRTGSKPQPANRPARDSLR
jgi:hypothetical protein